ncbi:hypothetical protein L484_020630 [Morus notabilis]|uniref:Uncharacterized protein n=1 Tax=Morus notabilis TaxID=981085 RepID=W9SXI2_9ROSA|nr:hypothetical protein L484_020630 [Morus notabilis]
MPERLIPYTHSCVRTYEIRNNAPYWVIVDKNRTTSRRVSSLVQESVWKPPIVPPFSWSTKVRSGPPTKRPTVVIMPLSRKSSRITSRAKAQDAGSRTTNDARGQNDTDASSSVNTCIFGCSTLLFFWQGPIAVGEVPTVNTRKSTSAPTSGRISVIIDHAAGWGKRKLADALSPAGSKRACSTPPKDPYKDFRLRLRSRSVKVCLSAAIDTSRGGLKGGGCDSEENDNATVLDGLVPQNNKAAS